jgi:hypothetical protein
MFIRRPEVYQDQTDVKKWISGDIDDSQAFDNDTKYED